jgi:hypothetical protein
MKPPIHSPEFKLLLSCCRVIPSIVETNLREEVLSSKIDEDLFYSLILRHRIGPIIYHNLKIEDRISEGLKTKLKLLSDENILKSLATKQMIIKIQREFNIKKYKRFFLKGITLAEKYYGDVSLRHSLDLDFWVEGSGIEAMSSFLLNEGYKSDPSFSELNETQLNYVKRIDHDLQFINAKNDLLKSIELHWKIRGSLGSFSFDPNLDYDKLARFKVGSETIKVFDEIDNLLYLCTHGTEHAWFRLKWLFDLPQILDKVEFDWNEVIRRAIELKCLDQLIISFVVLNQFIDQEIPSAIMELIDQKKIQPSLDFIYESILSETTFNENDSNRIKYLGYSISQSKNGIFNTQLLMKYLTGPSDWKLLPLPEKLFFLYFPLRPFLLLWRRLAGNKS